MSTVKTNSLDTRDLNTTIDVLPQYTLYSPGAIIQVIQTYLIDPFSQSIPASYNTYTDITGLAATITPKSTSSKIYISARWSGEMAAQSDMLWNSMFNLKRNSSLIGQPSQPGSLTIGIMMAGMPYYANDSDSTPETASFDYYDSPSSVSALTYQVSYNSTTAGTLYTNRCVNGAIGGTYERLTSSIILMEIAG